MYSKTVSLKDRIDDLSYRLGQIEESASTDRMTSVHLKRLLDFYYKETILNHCINNNNYTHTGTRDGRVTIGKIPDVSIKEEDDDARAASLRALGIEIETN